MQAMLPVGFPFHQFDNDLMLNFVVVHGLIVPIECDYKCKTTFITSLCRSKSTDTGLNISKDLEKLCYKLSLTLITCFVVEPSYPYLYPGVKDRGP